MPGAGGGMDLRVTGLDDVRKLAKDLRAAGDKDLKRELREAGKRIAKPAPEAIRKSALATLPAKNGLNVWVAGRMRFSTGVRLAGKNVGIEIKARRPGANGLSDLPAINRGRVRAPLFGDRGHWYTHPVPPGFADKALDGMADTAREEFLKAAENVARKFAAGG